MTYKKLFFLFFLLFFSSEIFSQDNFYNTDTVQEIRIYFYDTQWDTTLDSLYVLGQKQRILADLVINGSYYDSVGVRYKGFSSVSVNRVKNPFNIKLDYVIENQDHEGIEKIKLSNVIQDPSFVREVLTYEICRKYLPSSQANYANVYINDTLWGLYTNVEAVNKDFLIDHFDSKYNAFFKCNPENLNIQIGGENSNLSNTHGLDSSDYYSFYDIESESGWLDLYNLIDTLNNFQDSIHHVLNIDRALWMHAINYSMINFDSYIGYGQNYYLYKDQAKQFNTIIWDLNMSFGGFRLTDASQLYFNGFDILQAQNMDPLNHYSLIATSPRPLMKKLFLSSRKRKMYLAHIRTIMQENFANQDYFIRAQHFQNLIDTYVQNDTNKFYSYTDFVVNLNNQVALPTSLCPGISQLMDARLNYLSSYTGYTGEPTISSHNLDLQSQNLGSDLWVSTEVFNASYVMMSYRYGKNQRFRTLEMFDDGNHNDGMAGDNIYGAKLNNCSNSIDYYFYADNDSSGVFSPTRAAYEFYNANISLAKGDLVINELMSNNETIASDPSGKYDDWIELYNTSNFPISTNNLYLSDTLNNIYKWKLPNLVLKPDDYLIIWADEDGNQGEKHANFKLSNLGETLTLFTQDSILIDSITYLAQLEDISFAREPNGTGSFIMKNPTFKSNNDVVSVNNIFNKERVLLYPNPFTNQLTFGDQLKYIIKDVFGREVTRGSKRVLNTSLWSTGVYFVYLEGFKEKVIKVVKL